MASFDLWNRESETEDVDSNQVIYPIFYLFVFYFLFFMSLEI